MWDYKVIAGSYALDGAEVIVENPMGRGTLQRILDHYGAEGFELVSSHYDALNREVVVLLKKPKPGFVPTMAAAMPAAAMPEPEPEPAPRGRGARGGGGGARGGGGKRRLSKEELDRLYRD